VIGHCDVGASTQAQLISSESIIIKEQEDLEIEKIEERETQVKEKGFSFFHYV
jgi:hypothetical protein